MPHRVRIINPNSNTSMTDSLRAPIDSLNYSDTEYTFFTGPASAPYSINNLADAEASTTACLSLLSQQSPGNATISSTKASPSYDANLIACYSPHPLIPALQSLSPSVPTLGIFEASVQVAIQLLSSLGYNQKEEKKRKFGIISTGLQWKNILNDALTADVGIGAGLGKEGAKRWFAGTECVGVDAGDLHPSEPPPHTPNVGEGEPESGNKIKNAVMAATGRLLDRGDVGVIMLGCAGMVGMEEWAREEVVRRGLEGVRVVDGVKAGVGVLQGIVRGGF
ncbi:MAG: hypothetical protein Q9192_004671 [Flavoplaca navasiana]